jgi:hypothetical protein
VWLPWLSWLMSGVRWATAAWIALVSVIALVGALHPSPQHRADARKVLDQLLGVALVRARASKRRRGRRRHDHDPPVYKTG